MSAHAIAVQALPEPIEAVQPAPAVSATDLVRRYGDGETCVEALDAVGLGDRADHRPNQLSGGQQQRVAIARAIVSRPRVFLADEPTGNLDSTSAGEVMAILDRLHDDGATIVLVTHSHDVGRHASRILRVADGMLAE